MITNFVPYLFSCEYISLLQAVCCKHGCHFFLDYIFSEARQLSYWRLQYFAETRNCSLEIPFQDRRKIGHLKERLSKF